MSQIAQYFQSNDFWVNLIIEMAITLRIKTQTIIYYLPMNSDI